jgi:transposase-like protein
VERVRFQFVSHRSAIGTRAALPVRLPKYMRRAPGVDALIPALYLKGISTGDFSEALSAILGVDALREMSQSVCLPG